MAPRRQCRVNSEYGLNVREQPADDAEILRVLPDGEIVTLSGTAKNPRGWKALADGGYVMAKYLK